jgi:hypothetical protein
MIKTFSEDVYVLGCNTHTTAIADGKFPASGSFIDVSDFERFVFVVDAGSLDSALTLQVEEATAADGTPTDITGATATVGATDDGETFIIEVETRRMTLTGKRYVTLDVTGAAGGNDYLSIMFYGLNKGSLPVTQPSGTNTPVIIAG